MKAIKGYFFTITAAIAFGVQPFLAMQVYGYGVGSNMLAFFRVLFMIPIFAVLVLFSKNGSFKIDGRQLVKTAFLALTGAVLTTVLLFKSYNYIDTGTATTLNFSYPVFVLALGVILYKDKIKNNMLLSFLLCIAGVVLFCNFKGDFSWLGFTMALGSGLTYGVYILYLDKSGLMDEMGFCPFSFYFFALSSVLLAPIAAAFGEFTVNIAPVGWVFILVFALDGGIVATTFLQIGIREIGGKKASIISALEPVTSIVLGALFFDESITLAKMIGIVLILASTVVLVSGREDGGLCASKC